MIQSTTRALLRLERTNNLLRGGREEGREGVRGGEGGRLWEGGCGREGGREGGRKGRGGEGGEDDCYTYSNIIQWHHSI